jgi:dienelactone hydrolase
MVAESALFGNTLGNAIRLGLLCLTLVALQAAGSFNAHAQPKFDSDHVGPPGSGRDGELFMAYQGGPFPAVVVLHGCEGMGKHYRDWGKLLRTWGYAVLLVDSFGPRGQGNICNRGNLVSSQERLKDAYRAADYLRTLPNIRHDRIGVIGFSHGGGAVLNLVTQPAVPSGSTPFSAAVAFYPPCDRPTAALLTDTLILIGAADNWTPARDCQRWQQALPPGVHTIQLKIYPDAHHAFDTIPEVHDYLGHTIGHNEGATAQAEADTRAFLAQRLMAR